MERNSNAAAVAWIALIAAILALILAWVAYNRTGVDLEEQIQMEVEEAVDEVNLEEAVSDIQQGASDALEATEQAAQEVADEVDNSPETE